jgi:hypothetical protein
MVEPYFLDLPPKPRKHAPPPPMWILAGEKKLFLLTFTYIYLYSLVLGCTDLNWPEGNSGFFGLPNHRRWGDIFLTVERDSVEL